MHSKKIEASLLAFNLDLIDDELSSLKELGLSIIHYDVMDGFVNNHSFGTEWVEKIISYGYQINVHLMVFEPMIWMEDFFKFPISSLTFQYEAIGVIDSLSCIEKIKANNIKAGIAIKPFSKPNEFEKLLDNCDIVTIMTVEPGKGGQSLIEEAIQNLKFVYSYRKLNKLNFIIEVDGGIKKDNFELVSNYADCIISGTGLIGLSKKERYEFINEIQRGNNV
ncbi:MAG: ribulose-phosphate 3-epimerase [Mycoplasma sp.]